jgi:hypothetical protein
MIEIITNMIDIIGRYGLPLVISGIVTFFFYKLCDTILKLIINKLNDKKNSETNKRSALIKKPTVSDCPGKCNAKRPGLINHYFFTESDTLIRMHIPKMECGCEGRTLLFTDMCRIFCTSWRDYLFKLVENENTIKISTEYTFSTKMVTDFIGWWDSLSSHWCSESIPEVAIRVFSRHVDNKLDKLRDAINLISSSKYYFDNFERMSAMLSVHETAMKMLILDLRQILIMLNGQLDGIEYKGYKIKLNHGAEKEFKSEPIKKYIKTKSNPEIYSPTTSISVSESTLDKKEHE